MPALASLRNRLRALLQRDRLERELDAELAAHIEMQAEANRRRGMAPEQARRAAGVDPIRALRSA